MSGTGNAPGCRQSYYHIARFQVSYLTGRELLPVGEKLTKEPSDLTGAGVLATVGQRVGLRKTKRVVEQSQGPLLVRLG